MASNGLTISSSDFDAGGRMPDRLAREHGNEVPHLSISGVPDDAVELATVCHDPDAPMPRGFTHWTLYGIPTDTSTIDAEVASTLRSGPNDFGDTGWGGPRPPAGHGDHHYYFWVYALSRAVDGAPDRDTFLDDYGDAVIEQSRVVGIYSA